MLIPDDYRSNVGGVCIDGVVKCLVHTEPLTCATEASRCIDTYSERQEGYKSRVVSDHLKPTALLTLGKARLVPLNDRI